MPAIGMRQLRADLATALRRAAAGEELVVTVSGEPVARLAPVAGRTSDPAAPNSGGTDPAETVRLLVASGALLAPRRSGRPVHADPLQLHPAPRLDLLVRDVR